ncbi:Uncharacterized protein dnm_078170 [Desulfonema magnum]|uniref:Uncharacterized protein n=1 Tax=Desulfonema magnum TaxID=45655 RepID=A0A975BUX7_9BACT|nr:Uncharacterized protein dnm_078170 [Desulfonema magnum]
MHQAKNAGRLPDGVCNPVRNVYGRRSGKYSGRGCKPRPAKTAGRGLQPRPKRLFSGVGKYFGRGCKPRPADHRLIKTMSYDLSLMHMGCKPRPAKGLSQSGHDRRGRNPAFSGRGGSPSGKKAGFLCSPAHGPETFRSADRL